VCSNGNWPRLGMPMSNDLSWNDAREARLDRAIDRAVREIMQIDPPPGLRRRVLAQLKQRPPRPRHLLLQFAVAMTVIALGLVSGTRMWYRVPDTKPRAITVNATANCSSKCRGRSGRCFS